MRLQATWLRGRLLSLSTADDLGRACLMRGLQAHGRSIVRTCLLLRAQYRQFTVAKMATGADRRQADDRLQAHAPAHVACSSARTASRARIWGPGYESMNQILIGLLIAVIGIAVRKLIGSDAWSWTIVAITAGYAVVHYIRKLRKSSEYCDGVNSPIAVSSTTQSATLRGQPCFLGEAAGGQQAGS